MVKSTNSQTTKHQTLKSCIYSAKKSQYRNAVEMSNNNPYAYVAIIKTKGVKGEILTSVKYFRATELETAKAFCYHISNLDKNCLMIDLAELLNTFYVESQTLETLNAECNIISNTS